MFLCCDRRAPCGVPKLEAKRPLVILGNGYKLQGGYRSPSGYKSQKLNGHKSKADFETSDFETAHGARRLQKQEARNIY
jgi:hypothetical protein